MVPPGPQTRLLTNLLKSEKDYTTSLSEHLLVSHTAIASLQAYASSCSPYTAHAIGEVARALKAADESISTYITEVQKWRDALKDVRSVEEEVAVVTRDREILVTRLIKISKQKPQREGHKHSPFSTSSPTSSFQAHPNDNSQEKLVSAQNELQACENHLNRKKQELEDVRTNVVKEGLWRRCRAMTQLGWSFNERGKEGLSALEGMGTPIPNGILEQVEKPLPLPRGHSPLASDLSLAPSQSASQINLSDQVPPSPMLSRPYELDIPPAHSVSEDFHIPSSRMQPPPEEPQDGSSSDSDIGPVQVVENQLPQRRFSIRSNKGKMKALTQSPVPGSPQHAHVHFPSSQRANSSDLGPRYQLRDTGPSSPLRESSDQPRERKRSLSLFGGIAGFFRGKPKRADSEPPPDNGAARLSTRKWATRTDNNLARARGRTDSSSEEDLPKNAVEFKNQAPKTKRAASPPQASGSRGVYNGAHRAHESAPTIPSENEISRKAPKKLVKGGSSPTRDRGKGNDTQSANAGSPGVSRSGTVKSTMSEPPPRRANSHAREGSGSNFASVSRMNTIQEGQNLPSSRKTLVGLDPSPALLRRPSGRESQASPQRSASLDSPSGSTVKRKPRVSGPGATNLMSLVEDMNTGAGTTRSTFEIVKSPKSPTNPDWHGKENGSGKAKTKEPSKEPAKLVLPSDFMAKPAFAEKLYDEPRVPSSQPVVASSAPRQIHPPQPINAAKQPLRSAMRTRSPSPAVRSSPPTSNVAPAPTGNKILFPVPSASTSNKRASMTPSDFDDDTSSYETGHEYLSDDGPGGKFVDAEEGDDSTEKDEAPTPPPHTPPNKNIPLPTHLSQKEKEHASTDLSMSSTSTIPRRKSVRMALPPPTPEAESKKPDWSEANDVTPRANGSMAAGWTTHHGNGTADVDMWEDSSDEGSYGRAKKALVKAQKKFEHAGDIDGKSSGKKKLKY